MPVGFAVSRVFLLIGCIVCQIWFFHAIVNADDSSEHQWKENSKDFHQNKELEAEQISYEQSNQWLFL